MITIQQYLNQIKDKNKIKVISVNRNYFFFDSESSELVFNYEGGDLDLSQFPNLEHLELSAVYLSTPLTSLNLNNCANLETVIVSHNDLTNLGFLNQLPNPTKLKELVISSNDFLKSDLKIFSKFTNLEELRIGTSWGVINQQETDGKPKNKWKYNRFQGSLEPLKDLTKLKFLDFENTDIDDGIEHLPLNLVQVSREKKAKNIFASGVISCHNTKIDDELNPYFYDIQSWKDANPHKLVFNIPNQREVGGSAIEKEQNQNELEQYDYQIVEMGKQLIEFSQWWK